MNYEQVWALNFDNFEEHDVRQTKFVKLAPVVRITKENVVILLINELVHFHCIQKTWLAIILGLHSRRRGPRKIDL